MVVHLEEKILVQNQINILWEEYMQRTEGGRLQTTQPTSGGDVIAVTNCCANCVETSRPQQWGPDLPFFGQTGHADPLALLLIKAGDVETNPGQTTAHKQV